MLFRGLIISVLLGASFVFADGMRIFSDTKGRTMEACLLEVDSSNGKVRIETGDGRRVWVDPSLFSEPDQKYIHEWVQARKVLSEKTLQLSFEFNEEDLPKRCIVYDNRKEALFEDGRWGASERKVMGRFVLKNSSNQPVDSLRLEYFYLIRGGQEYRVFGAFKDVSMGAGQKVVLTGRECNLVEHHEMRHIATQENPSGVWKEVKDSVDAAIGMCVRIYGPELDGSAVFRDICVPESLGDDCAWDDWAATNAMLAVLGPSTMDEFNARGPARNEEQFAAWMRQISIRWPLAKTHEHPDIMRLKEGGIRALYKPEYDATGVYAFSTASSCRANRLYAEAAYWFEIALSRIRNSEASFVEKQMIEIYTALAEIYASADDANVQDGKKAIQCARILVEMDAKNDRYQELMARAYARNGQFDKAVKTQKLAIERLEKSRKNPDDLTAYKSRLALYESGKAFAQK
ncbi:MAG: hypothetical protein JXR25_01730 [Pontiellaceae bacterium]|nr:hypothetical protein [Pontiellaceae bacterium]MBN2783520.1 hypothetical protein [Pontiellaceae bacterium]